MKWFKHDTDALQDAKIEKLIMKYGLEGYGLYFACVELIAAGLSVDNCSFELEHDEKLLAHKFKKSPNKIKEMLAFMIEIGLFQYNEDSKHIVCIKLLKRVDNTMSQNQEIKKIQNNGNFKKLKETLSNLKSFKTDKIRKDTDTDNLKQIESFFDQFWELYPKKVAKSKTRSIFIKLKPDEKLFNEIIKGLQTYLRCDQWQKNKGQFIPYPATFLNQERWKDEIGIKKKSWTDFD